MKLHNVAAVAATENCNFCVYDLHVTSTAGYTEYFNSHVMYAIHCTFEHLQSITAHTELQCMLRLNRCKLMFV